MMIVPTMQISWTFFSIVSGMLYFQEYKDFTIWNGIMFAIAVMVGSLFPFCMTACLTDYLLRSVLTDKNESHRTSVVVTIS